MQNCDLLGETKLVPPRKGKNANHLSIKHVYLRVARGDLLERIVPVVAPVYNGLLGLVWYSGGYEDC